MDILNSIFLYTVFAHTYIHPWALWRRWSKVFLVSSGFKDSNTKNLPLSCPKTCSWHQIISYNKSSNQSNLLICGIVVMPFSQSLHCLEEIGWLIQGRAWYKYWYFVVLVTAVLCPVSAAPVIEWRVYYEALQITFSRAQRSWVMVCLFLPSY